MNKHVVLWEIRVGFLFTMYGGDDMLCDLAAWDSAMRGWTNIYSYIIMRKIIWTSVKNCDY